MTEPKSAYFLRQNGHAATWSGEAFLGERLPPAAQKKLGDKVWLVHESVWWNRHLKGAGAVANWVTQNPGVQWQLPFAHGKDCIDCGGEGAYPHLFPEQAKKMAQEFWEKDQHRAAGIFCFSQRCVEHFKKSLGPNIPIIGIEDLWRA